MRLGTGNHTYEWLDRWASLPDTPSHRENGRTHGVAATASGEVVVFCQASPAVLFFDAQGQPTRSWGDRFLGAHGLTLTSENGVEYLWLTDQNTAEVAKMTLQGQTVLSLERPDLPLYRQNAYVPTWVAVNEVRQGGNGDVWVSDGYGQSHIHRYDKTGRYLATINGQEGQAGAFQCPHGIWFDYRRGEPELYIADRSNRRVQVYDAQGRFKRVFGNDFLTSPCAFVSVGPYLAVPELRACVTILDENDKPMCRLGLNEGVCDLPGWPNHDKKLIQNGKFNSPHGIGADDQGNLYVVEWIVGGRITKLAKC